MPEVLSSTIEVLTFGSPPEVASSTIEVLTFGSPPEVASSTIEVLTSDTDTLGPGLYVKLGDEWVPLHVPWTP